MSNQRWRFCQVQVWATGIFKINWEKTKLPHVVLMYGPMSMGDGGPHLCFFPLKSNLVIIMKFFTDGIHNANYDFYIFLQVVIPCFCQEASTVSRSNLAFLSAFLRPSSANMDGCSTFVKQPYAKKRGWRIKISKFSLLWTPSISIWSHRS